MKTLIISTLLLLSNICLAETKPVGSLIPSMCGFNNLESVSAGPNYPSEVCLYTMQGPDDTISDKQYLGVQTSKGIKYYEFGDVVTDDKGNKKGVEMLPAKTKVKGNYTFVKSVDEDKVAFTLTMIFGDDGELTWKGPLFQVTPQIIAVTF